MIRVCGLNYTVPSGKRILKDITFSIQPGEFVALIGHNGAGKSSLIQHLNGLIKPAPGKVTVAGLDAAVTPTSTLAQHIGFLFQNPDHQIFNNTVHNEFLFGLKNMGLSHAEIEERIQTTAGLVGLGDKLAESPFTLSRGFRQRLAYGAVLAMNPEILVLDEPTTGHDYRESRQTMELVKQLNQEGKTVLMVSHDMDMIAEYAQRVILLDDGRIVRDGAVAEVMSDSDSLMQSGLMPPSIISLANSFVNAQLDIKSSNTDDMFQEIMQKLGVSIC
ncbi:MAG TPA: ATP-binding cassette domain-containing protein [Bacillota bacterium]|nr:ATP-binding cassette domain-containing protein [Bacillota bacterium]